MQLLWRWLISTGVIMATAYILPGIDIKSIYVGFMVSLILGLVNATVRPILILITMPATIMTMGIFIVVVNGFLLYVVSTFIPGFSVHSFQSSITAAIVISIFSWFLNIIINTEEKIDTKKYGPL